MRAKKNMYLIGVDIGSSATKVVLFNYRGDIVDIAYRQSKPLIRVAQNGTREVLWAPEKIWGNVAEGIKEIVGKVNDSTHIRAIAVSGFGSDGVPIDHNGNWLHPFISWHDTRTYAQLEEFKQLISDELVYGITGIRPWYYHTILRLMWMKRNKPKVYDHIYKWLVVTDFINYRLSGQIATDFSEASTTLMFDQTELKWAMNLFEMVGIDSNLFPQPRASGTILGRVTEEAATITGLNRQTYVVLGGHDNIVSSFACGGNSSNALVAVTGTFESVMCSIDKPIISNIGMANNLACDKSVVPGKYIVWGAQNAGMVVTWFKDALLQGKRKRGSTESALYKIIDSLKAAEPGAKGIFMLPDLIGSTTPIDDPKSRAAILGIGESHRIEDFIQAMIEGINYRGRSICDVIGEVTNTKIEKVINIGGASHSEYWMQNKADITGKYVEVPSIEEATALGAAMIAGVGAGVYQDHTQAYEMTKREGKIYEPDPRRRERYAVLYDVIFKRMYGATKEISHLICKLFQ